MTNLIYNFFVHNKQKRLTVHALLLSAKYRALLRFVPVARLRPRFGAEGQETPCEPLETEDLRRVWHISNRVNRVANRTPWESKCFVRALVAQRLLKSYGLPSTFYLGVAKEGTSGMKAHAWIRSGPHYITGGNGEEFAIVAKFTRYPRGWQGETAL